MLGLSSRILIILLLQIALPCTLGYGGIRRRAWGQLHMLRSGKRGDLPPLLPGRGYLPLDEGRAAAGVDAPLPGAPRVILVNLLDRKDVGGDEPERGEIVLPDYEELDTPIKRARDGHSRWGNLHMLRSGRSVLSAPAARSQQKRGGFWGYGRPRWGSGHMLRSGRSDPSLRLESPSLEEEGEGGVSAQSMEEVEELANNQNYQARNIE